MAEAQCQWGFGIVTALAGWVLGVSAGCQPLATDTLGGFVGDFLRQLIAALLL